MCELQSCGVQISRDVVVITTKKAVIFIFIIENVFSKFTSIAICLKIDFILLVAYMVRQLLVLLSFFNPCFKYEIFLQKINV